MGILVARSFWVARNLDVYKFLRNAGPGFSFILRNNVLAFVLAWGFVHEIHLWGWWDQRVLSIPIAFGFDAVSVIKKTKMCDVWSGKGSLVWGGGHWATVWVWNGGRRSVTARCLRLCFHILCTTASRKLPRHLLPAQAWSGLQTALLILTKESVCCPASDLKSLGYFKICLSIHMVLCCLLCCCGRNEGIEVCIYLFLM